MSWERWKERCERPEETPKITDVEFSCVAYVRDVSCVGWYPLFYLKIQAVWRGKQIWRHVMNEDVAVKWGLTELHETFASEMAEFLVEDAYDRVRDGILASLRS